MSTTFNGTAACTCANFRGSVLGPDHEAEQVAALIASGVDQRIASLRVWAPHLLPGRVSVSERLRARLREAGEAAEEMLFWLACVLAVALIVAVAWLTGGAS